MTDPLIRFFSSSTDIKSELYEVYHENSKLYPPPEIKALIQDPGYQWNQLMANLTTKEMEQIVSAGSKRYTLAPHLALPEPDMGRLSICLKGVLSHRNSVSSGFDPRPLNPEIISLVLKMAYGWNGERRQESEDDPINYRFVPSAGRLYPLEIYLVAREQEPHAGWRCYHYDAEAHQLECIADPKPEHIAKAFISLPDPAPPLILFITGIPARLAWKYGARSYRYALLEAGHVGQNLALTATALQIQSCPIASYYDDQVHDLLDMDGVSEMVLHSFFLGYSQEQPNNA